MICNCLARREGEEILWNQGFKTPYFHYRDDEGNRHQVWFENHKSLKFKLDLVKNIFWESLSGNWDMKQRTSGRLDKIYAKTLPTTNHIYKPGKKKNYPGLFYKFGDRTFWIYNRFNFIIRYIKFQYSIITWS